MKRIYFYAIPLALLLVMIGGLTTGCEGLFSGLTPPASEYPADIIGRVTIADKLIADGEEVRPYGINTLYWIVEVSLKNKDYQYPVTSVRDKSIPLPEGVSHIWSLILNGKQWATPVLTPTTVTVSQGESGNMMFPFEMGEDDKTSDIQISYRGQEPYSYGNLLSGNTVAAYDWDLKKATQAEGSQKTIANVEDIWVGHVPNYCIVVELKPTSKVVANKVYVADLYEKGKLRATINVSWNQPEINVLSVKAVWFPATKEEYDAYLWEDISHIFSVKVHE